MVSNPRKTPSIGGSYQPLNLPMAVQVVSTSDGQPASVTETRKGRAVSSRVEHVIDLWELDDEWWRATSVRRRYFRLLMDTGRVLTVFKDLSSGEWFRQEY